jgi:VanZ family protein
MTQALSQPSPPPDAGAAPRPATLQLIWYWGVVALWMAVISLMSTDPFSAANTHRYLDPMLRFLFPHLSATDYLYWHYVIRKTAHFGEFFVLGALAFWACRRGRSPRWRAAWMVQALLVAMAYALLDEAHQAFVPSRTASLADSGIDSLGAAVSQLCIYLRHLVAR